MRRTQLARTSLSISPLRLRATISLRILNGFPRFWVRSTRLGCAQCTVPPVRCNNRYDHHLYFGPSASVGPTWLLQMWMGGWRSGIGMTVGMVSSASCKFYALHTRPLYEAWSSPSMRWALSAYLPLPIFEPRYLCEYVTVSLESTFIRLLLPGCSALHCLFGPSMYSSVQYGA